MRRLRKEIAATEDAERRGDLRFLAGWMAAERGSYSEALELFREPEDGPESLAWATDVEEEPKRMMDSLRLSLHSLEIQ